MPKLKTDCAEFTYRGTRVNHEAEYADDAAVVRRFPGRFDGASAAPATPATPTTPPAVPEPPSAPTDIADFTG